MNERNASSITYLWPKILLQDVPGVLARHKLGKDPAHDSCPEWQSTDAKLDLDELCIKKGAE